MDTFLVNLNDPTGERYMKLTLRLTISPEKIADEIKNQEILIAKMRDRVLTILMAKTFQEIDTLFRGHLHVISEKITLQPDDGNKIQIHDRGRGREELIRLRNQGCTKKNKESG